MRSLLLITLATGCWTASAPEPAKPQVQPKKIVIKDLVQPVKIEKQEVAGVDSDPCGDPCGGVVGGVVGGVPGGVVGGAPPPPPPPPPPPTVQNVSPTTLEGNRIAGDKMIAPDDVTKTEIARAGRDKIVASFKLCLTDAGQVSSVAMLKSSGFNAYDAKIQREIRLNWRYKPYFVNGKPVPVCTAVTFIYSQSQPTLPPPVVPKP